MISSPPLGKVLLIDDNRFGQSARRDILEEAGYKVVTAESGARGLECIEASAAGTSFNLVITDYRMPSMRGDEVVQRIRELQPDLPLVILSGQVKALGLTPESTGADVVLAKGPREQDDLTATVAAVILAQLPRRPIAAETGSATGDRRRAAAPTRRLAVGLEF